MILTYKEVASQKPFTFNSDFFLSAKPCGNPHHTEVMMHNAGAVVLVVAHAEFIKALQNK
jgi:hypothetical protein